MDIIEECVKWNAARYDRISCEELSIALLTEEINELYEAGNLVEMADACGDITFVCIGALWKLGFSNAEISLVLDNKLFPLVIADLAGVRGNFGDKVNELSYLIYLALHSYVNSYAEQYGLIPLLPSICEAICVSNNTKSIEGKTDPSVNANKTKGPSYVPPTATLIRILRKLGEN